MKSIFTFLLTVTCLCTFSQQQVLVVGQKQGMMFTDIMPDNSYSCSWPNGSHSCSANFHYDVNHDGADDFYISHVYVECNLNSFRVWQIYPISNVEFLLDSMGITPFNAGDSIVPDSNSTTDVIYNVNGYDSVNNPIYDTTYLPRSAWWLDTSDLSYERRLIAHIGGGGPGCSGEPNWGYSIPDTNYFVFRLIQSSDTSYGWFKAYSPEDFYFGLIGESFAITGDTGSFIYNSIEPVQKANVNLFPNPFSTQLTFSFADNEQKTISLYDFLGQQILQQTFTNSTTINTEQMQDGIYFYELRNSKGTLKTGKLVKQ